MGGIRAGLWSDDVPRPASGVVTGSPSEGMGIPDFNWVHHRAVRLLSLVRSYVGAFRYTRNISGIPESRIYLKGDRKMKVTLKELEELSKKVKLSVIFIITTELDYEPAGKAEKSNEME